MIIDVHPPIDMTPKIIITVLQCTGIFLTLFRMCYRACIRRFWWEDCWAGIASLAGATCIISGWLHVTAYAPEVPTVSCWVYTIAFACMVYTVRMSLLCSVVRLIYPANDARRILLRVSLVFALFSTGVIIGQTYVCASSHNWHGPYHGCMAPPSVVAYEFITDVISDTTLVVLPLRLLWHIHLPTKLQRRMILSIFSSTIIISLISLVRAISRMMTLASLVLTASDLEVALCLIIYRRNGSVDRNRFRQRRFPLSGHDSISNYSGLGT
ncbi:hypothetical protein BJ138DRAFT_172397 [Hygrophoropsis aurantiaca]|uniref:Uncharacterized protein n=1 Tax=Hygrophoropsis aurantiaca TaxID=72124 RepID=A0ACB8AQX5_9AGAM|nr:hypothetical protein BJ138DRAFT_172397 [Hygrophoropsis aurantiaca]